MYQAIVFLPLLGAILAALITLAGARARFPGGSPESAGEHHGHAVAADHGTHTAEATHDDHHAPAEPAAAGSRAAELITTVFLFISMILSWIAFATVGFGHDERVQIMTWMASGDLRI